MSTQRPEDEGPVGASGRPTHDPMFEDPSDTPPVLDPTWREPRPATGSVRTSGAAAPSAPAQDRPATPAPAPAAAPEPDPDPEPEPMPEPVPAPEPEPEPHAAAQPEPERVRILEPESAPPEPKPDATAQPEPVVGGQHEADPAAAPEPLAATPPAAEHAPADHAPPGDAEPAAAAYPANAADAGAGTGREGRLYRSVGAEGAAAVAATPALSADALATLRSVARRTGDDQRPVISISSGTVAAGAAAPAAGAAVGAWDDRVADPAMPGDAAPGPAAPPAAGTSAGAAAGADAGTAGSLATEGHMHAGGGLTATGVWVVVVGVTVMVGFADALITGELRWITGLGLLASTVYAALLVRPMDLWVAVIAPPLAFLAATLTAGQLTVSGGGSLLTREALLVFESLSFNAPWILGSTALALVIVWIRRRRYKKSGIYQP
ncbi:MAG: DUF6542 domain-containing protein [Candidatus Nanopelagicales bacterium]